MLCLCTDHASPVQIADTKGLGLGSHLRADLRGSHFGALLRRSLSCTEISTLTGMGVVADVYSAPPAAGANPKANPMLNEVTST